MHEMSLCEGIVQILENEAGIQHYQRVKTVWLEVGDLAGVEIAALEFSFDIVCRGTLAEGSRLEIVRLPATAWCLHCEREVIIKQRMAPCPECGGYQLQVTAGEDLRIKELEVE